jgi:hypothetical protein
MEQPRFTWRIESRGAETVVAFEGVLDERSDLGELHSLAGDSGPRVEDAAARPNLVFDLEAVRRVTSGGVTRWIRFLSALDPAAPLAFERCSVAVVTQLNMVRGFRGRATIRSFFAPYVCEETGDEQEILLTPEQVPGASVAPVLDSPAGALVLNDLPKRYFAFLKQG